MQKQKDLIDSSKVDNVDAKHSVDKKDKLRHINMLVESAQAGDIMAMDELVVMHGPLITKIAKRYYTSNRCLFSWDELYSQVRSTFVELTLRDYTIGGTAYYNVYIQHVLKFRTLYYVETLIKNNKRHTVLDDDNIYAVAAVGVDDIINCIYARDVMERSMGIVQKYFSERDYNIFCDYFVCGETNCQVLSAVYGVTAARISSIVTSIKNYLRAAFAEERDTNVSA